jgi:hypothetical protein
MHCSAMMDSLSSARTLLHAVQQQGHLLRLSNSGHEWMIGVSVSFSGSILHLKLTPNILTP